MPGKKSERVFKTHTILKHPATYHSLCFYLAPEVDKRIPELLKVGRTILHPRKHIHACTKQIQTQQLRTLIAWRDKVRSLIGRYELRLAIKVVV